MKRPAGSFAASVKGMRLKASAADEDGKVARAPKAKGKAKAKSKATVEKKAEEKGEETEKKAASATEPAKGSVAEFRASGSFKERLESCTIT